MRVVRGKKLEPQAMIYQNRGSRKKGSAVLSSNLNFRNVTGILVMLLVILCSYGYAQTGYRGKGASPWMGTASASADNGDEDAAAEEDFDLESCQRFCLGSPAGSNRSAGALLASCLQDCNERYWKAYDRRMKKLGN